MCHGDLLCFVGFAWGWGLTSGFAGVFEGVFGKKVRFFGGAIPGMQFDGCS
jgi:hypothetical protein